MNHGRVDGTKRVLIHGAAANVGAHAVQFAKAATKEVPATALPQDVDYVHRPGANRVIDVQRSRFEDVVNGFDVVIDTVGGELSNPSVAVLKPGGVMVSSAAAPTKSRRHGTTYELSSLWWRFRRASLSGSRS